MGEYGEDDNGKSEERCCMVEIVNPSLEEQRQLEEGDGVGEELMVVDLNEFESETGTVVSFDLNTVIKAKEQISSLDPNVNLSGTVKLIDNVIGSLEEKKGGDGDVGGKEGSTQAKAIHWKVLSNGEVQMSLPQPGEGVGKGPQVKVEPGEGYGGRKDGDEFITSSPINKQKEGKVVTGGSGIILSGDLAEPLVEPESVNGQMDKLPIELAQGETLVSLDGLDDVESVGGNSQDCHEKMDKDIAHNLVEVATATGEVVKLKKPRSEEAGVRKGSSYNDYRPPMSPSHHADDGSFPCTLCTQRFTRKLYLNNHMEEQHGVKYVFTERGRKVKLVRIPKNYDPQKMDDLDPSIRKLIKKSAGCHDLSKVVGVVTVPDPDNEEAGTTCTDTMTEDKSGEGEKENEEGVECGFLVDRITTVPYQKALSRGEVPFCAFSPISTQDLYLLRIQDCSDSTRHMLVPASKEDVFSTPGALKTIDEQEPGNDDALNYRVAIVAIARQIYSEEAKQLVVSVDPPLKKDKDKITCVKFLSLDKFADFAFLGFDGNVSEFAKNNESEEKERAGTEPERSQQPQTLSESTSPKPLSSKQHTPPRAPARRGRGGRRRVSRKSPPMPSSTFHNNQYHIAQAHGLPTLSSHNFTMQPLPPILPLPPEMSNDYDQAFVKMEQSQSQQFLTQIPVSQIPEPAGYSQDETIGASSDMSVPMPVSEVTVSTSEPGMENADEQTNHDIITIALDQLMPMTSGDGFNGSTIPPQTAVRGGRRPGRKPGRKPVKEREQVENDENVGFVQRTTTLNADGTVPKRRGRPPKNRILMPILGQENEHSSMDVDDYENVISEKRGRYQPFE